ncbi:MAG: DNA mismatch repair endonuclease MutL [Anaerolineae bacterium]|nr:DNA mismatch repair endonuclease MutL [Anaerolineae bacterium]
MQIKVLSEQLASQIAAGEVVERPASAVKELVENAIDAGATTINVDVREGGRKLIQVADDGDGIAAEEVELAFLRHATSKLDSAESLTAIRTLGFRGEALAAIASVSHVTVVTRSREATTGVRLALEGGHRRSQDNVGAPQGTVIAVENLFYNTPARLKFLKSITTEKRVIDEIVTHYALAYPQIRFRLTHDGRISFQSSGNGSVRDVLVAVYGADVARLLLSIDDNDGHQPATSSQSSIIVSGFVGPPSLHRANRNQITLFVNGRWIKDTRLTFAIVQAYHTLLPVGRYPMAVVFVTMAHELVDVNVHPTKTEVRFRDGNRVFGAVQRAVRDTLVVQTPVRPFAQLTPTANVAGWGGSLDRQAFVRPNQAPFDLPHPAGPDVEIGYGDSAEDEPATLLGGKQLPIMRVVGQVGASYIITEGPDGLFLIDQHAAHERIMYEQFMAAQATHTIASQGLVAGATIQLTPAQATLLEAQIERLAGLGFQIEPFGPNTFMVRAIPALLSRTDPVKAVLSVVEELEQDAQPLQETIEAQIIKRVCKTASVKQGQTLSGQEMEAMVRQLEACANPHTCPHGRPTMIHLSVAQLAREFGRM